MVKVTASMYALYGRHIYVTITGHGQAYEYRAINLIDARSFADRTLSKHFSGQEVEYAGDVILNFVYHREGD